MTPSHRCAAAAAWTPLMDDISGVLSFGGLSIIKVIIIIALRVAALSELYSYLK